jgi:thioredoxin-related protein
MAMASPLPPLQGSPIVAGGSSPDRPASGGSSGAGTAASVEWETGDLGRALSKAFASKRRLVAFFTDPEVQLSEKVEKQIFESKGFAARYRDAVFLRLTLSTDRSDVQRYGVFRVPTIIFFSTTGQESARLTGDITPEEFAKAYASSADVTAR